MADTKLAIAERRQRVGELRAQGLTLPSIAAELGISVGSVHSDLKAFDAAAPSQPVTGTEQPADGTAEPATSSEAPEQPETSDEATSEAPETPPVSVSNERPGATAPTDSVAAERAARDIELRRVERLAAEALLADVAGDEQQLLDQLNSVRAKRAAAQRVVDDKAAGEGAARRSLEDLNGEALRRTEAQAWERVKEHGRLVAERDQHIETLEGLVASFAPAVNEIVRVEKRLLALEDEANRLAAAVPNLLPEVRRQITSCMTQRKMGVPPQPYGGYSRFDTLNGVLDALLRKVARDGRLEPLAWK